MSPRWRPWIAWSTASAFAVATAVAASGALSASCDRPESARSSGCDDQQVVVDTQVMAYLSKARAVHHEANIKEGAGDLDGALAALGVLIATPRPHPQSRVAEVAEVLADTHARRAELLLAQAKLDDARREVTAGLDHAQTDSYFRGHLLEIAGLVEEADSKMLTERGDAERAEAARKKAISFLADAVAVQDRVIRRALGDASVSGDARPGR